MVMSTAAANRRRSDPDSPYPARRASARFGSFQFGRGKWQV
jgi:hypothetical protein